MSLSLYRISQTLRAISQETNHHFHNRRLVNRLQITIRYSIEKTPLPHKYIPIAILAIATLMLGCADTDPSSNASSALSKSSEPFVAVLGIAQDAGYPQAGCALDCCREVWKNPSLRQHATCLAIVDPISHERWLLECTPDFKDQLKLLNQLDSNNSKKGINGLSGIFLTHAHIGHYTGLIHLGHEVMGAKETPVHVMPRMAEFLRTSGPWSQLVDYKNIELRILENRKPVKLNERITVTPIQVPHRDEFSETVAFRVDGPNRSILFLPDIDKWNRWNENVETIVKSVDRAYVDGTFFGDGELPNRPMDQIPHPYIVETMDRFESAPQSERAKIHFIHFNHTNPVHNPNSDATKQTTEAGFNIARQNDQFKL